MSDINLLDDKEYETTLKPVIDWLSINDTPEKSDIIFAFGSLRLPEVWTQVEKLYKEEYAPHILVSGGMVKGVTQELGKPEALIIKEGLLRKGIPAEAILTEEESTNTLENVIFGVRYLKAQGIDIKNAILVAKPFHMRRCLATLKKQFSEINILCCPPQGSIMELIDRPKAEFAERIIGEFERLKIYAEKGDILLQEVPDDVARTLQQLKKLLEPK
jgi:hypothetical protein